MSDALERLKNRNRPTVPDRDISLTSKPAASTSQDISIPRSLETKDSSSQDSSPPVVQDLLKPLNTKQTTLRIESEVSDRLQDLCRENGICREVLIEAMFEYCENNPAALQGVLGEAKKKNEHRQSIANQKRAKSMMERFGQ